MADQNHLNRLPEGILPIILTNLPLSEAVKTSILYSRLRYEWKSLTDLVFDYQSLSQPDGQPLDQDNILRFITRCLSLHYGGTIHKLSLSGFELDESLRIVEWLHFISREDIKELTICVRVDDLFRVPKFVFSWSKLTYLKLSYCELNPPSDFSGFQCLKCLNLGAVTISPDSIEALISHCPLLESLKLSLNDPLVLTVKAPNLKHLSLQGMFRELSLGSMPLLVDISLSFWRTDDLFNTSGRRFKDLFGDVANLERLTGMHYLTTYVSRGYLGRDIQMSFEHLKCLAMYDVNFEDTKEIDVLIQMIAKSPVLEKLEFSNNESRSILREELSLDVLDVWGNGFMFGSLRTIKATELSCSQNEVKFLKFLLECSPSLKRMYAVPKRGVERQVVTDKLHPLSAYPRASAMAEIKFSDL